MLLLKAARRAATAAVGPLSGAIANGAAPCGAPRAKWGTSDGGAEEQRSAYGFRWADRFSWLQRLDQRTSQHLASEAEDYRAYLYRHRDTYRSVETYLRRVQVSEQASPAERCGPYDYYSRDDGAINSSILRRSLAAGQVEEVVLSDGAVARDAEAAAAELGCEPGGPGLEVGSIKISKDQSLLAYTLPHQQGADTHCAIVRAAAGGPVLLVLPSVMGIEWLADSCSLVFSVPDEKGRPWQVFRQLVVPLAAAGQQGRAQRLQAAAAPELLLEERDAARHLQLGRTKDWRYVTINSNSKLSCEVHLLDAHEPHSRPQLVQRRAPGLEYFVEHRQGLLHILTNAMGAANYCLATAPAPVPGPGGQQQEQQQQQQPSAPGAAGVEGWRVLVPERQDTAISDLDMFEQGCVLYERSQGRPRVSILRPGASTRAAACAAPSAAAALAGPAEVALPAWATCLGPGANTDYSSSWLRLSCASPVHPPATFDCSLASGQLQLLQQQEVQLPAAPLAARGPEAAESSWWRQRRRQGPKQPAVGMVRHQPSDYACQTVLVPSDGAQVPMTLAHRRDLQPDGSGPALLLVYGAYGHPLEPDFEWHRLALLQAGWVLAFAHVRGGGELGRRWHEQGRQLRKPASVRDFLCCAAWLQQRGYAAPGGLAASAHSAGGLVLGAAMNQQPGLLAAAVLRAPFVDLWGAMSDPSLPLTVHEYDEWGDPSDPGVAAMMTRLCPYLNLRPAEYPAVLVTAGMHDPRVPYWGPAKYAARLRECQLARGRPVLLRVEQEAGHFGAAGEQLYDVAEELTFLLESVPAAGAGAGAA